MSPFDVLTAEESKTLEAMRKLHSFRKGEFLFRSGDAVRGIFSLHSGVVKIMQPCAQQMLTVRLAAAGEWIGHRSIFTSDTYRGSALCKEPVMAHFVASEVLYRFFGTNREFAYQLIRLIARDLERAERRFLNYRKMNVASRLISLFRALDRKFGIDHGDGRLLATKLTKAEIAEMIGASQEVVTRQLSAWKAQKILSEEGKRLLLSRPLLNRVTRSDA